MKKSIYLLLIVLSSLQSFAQQKRDDGYRGIWYSIGSNREYSYKYGGGLGTYPSNHYPFAVYAPKVRKTFFCYGGTDTAGKTLYHEVGYFDHATGMVSRPTLVLDKQTDDAHDNPVMQVDKDGYIWLFSTSHGTTRPSFIHKSTKPYDISAFTRIAATKMENGKRVPLDNFSYLQVYYDAEEGFLALFTHYEIKELRYGKKNCRVIAYMKSADGVHWSEWKDIANMEEGHYQTSGQSGKRIGTAFNHHPNVKSGSGLDHRTNLYYLYTDDFGESWKTADGQAVQLPLLEPGKTALVKDYATAKLNVYINDLNFDAGGAPVILYETSKGAAPGPYNGPYEWHTARWTGKSWDVLPFTTSDHNYDMGSLMIEANGVWRVVAPTETGPQAFNTGGEVVMWASSDQGRHWSREKQLTQHSQKNHSYPRRPVNGHPGFYAFWADGNGRKPSSSALYFSDLAGNVFRLPVKMNRPMMKPEKIGE